MRILLINPNISESVSELIGAEARRAASPGTEIEVVTAPLGVAYIETRFEALIGAWAAANLAAEHASHHDAIVVAAFGDPGLAGIREAIDVPVVGLTEAALMSACMLGGRFSIVAISRRITAWYRETVQSHGLIERLASIRCLDAPLRDVGSVQTDHAARLSELCRSAVEEDGADVIIVAGAPLAGLARSMRDEIGVPLVDGVSSAVRHCETLVALAPTRARGGSYAKPPRKPNAGLSAALQALLNPAHSRKE
jgi:Asp/Glu/hydantoin racemase